MEPEDIAALRRSFGWTQEKMARELEVTPSYVSHLEAGRKRPSKWILHLLGKLLDRPGPGVTARRGIRRRLRSK